jgi:hypothetical protein
MLSKFLISFVVLFSVSANAAKEIKPLQTRAECKIANIPDYFPFQPRPVLNAYKFGDAARAAIRQNIPGVKSTLSLNSLGGGVITKTKVLAEEKERDPTFPTDGCIRSATLIAVGKALANEGTNSVEYGEVCEFSYSCADNR